MTRHPNNDPFGLSGAAREQQPPSILSPLPAADAKGLPLPSMNWYQANWYKSIGFKIILSVVATTLLANGFFAYVNLSIQESHMNQTIIRTAYQLSETIKKSIKFDMLENRKENAYRIMRTIGEQEGIEKVRIYSREGKIIFSTETSEFGRMVDKKAEACYGCHSEANPLVKLSTSERSRIYRTADGHGNPGQESRVLGMINPMYNEPDCSSAKCHAHPEAQKVLGVIDITMSLDAVDREITGTRNQVILFNILSIVAISTILVIILFRSVDRPVKELVLGTRRVAEGDLEYAIPIVSNDEMGHLASSFNQMTENLRKANEEIQEWIHSLERKVDDRTRELKEAQTQLLHSEKLIAIGKLAATVAHEINNPLAGVFTYIKLMERKIDQGQTDPETIAKYRDYLATMRREVERTTAIVRNLLDYTRPKEPVRKPVNIVRLVEESLSLVQNKLSLNNVVVKNRIEDLPEIMADPAQIKQVFLNIMINAAEAMEGGGILTISARHVPEEDAIVLAFCDTGIGIDPVNLAKVFDPFFTTKEKGTGLGLSVVNGIVTRHNGKVEVKSRIGKGTLIRITLPVG